MPFPSKDREDALVNSRRCCCVCHEFAGRNTNVHHIKPEASGGPSTIDNAIVLCLKCHGEAGHYNPKHPIGNKYSPEELLRHRDEWWSYCEKNPTKPFPMHPISVSPNSFRLVAGEWKTKLSVKITNNSENALYDVAVKFAIRVSGIKANDIVIDPPKRELELTHPIHGVEISGDLLRLNGIDAAGYEVFVIQAHSINPRETITFVLTNNSSYSPPPQTKQHAVISLLGFSEEPSEMLVEDNRTAIRFMAYEDWNITDVSVLMKSK
ncbi:MAG: HNH endonuclease [Anaerolineales bacterium]|nr:HNH endonuclease [Anaerolineales bacterium]